MNIFRVFYNMKFYRRLYVGKSVRKVNTVKWKLKAGAGQFCVYLITISRGRDQLDIFHCSLLKQKHFDRKQLYVVGIAADMGEAYQLVGRMLADTLQAGMEGDIKGYLLSQAKSRRGGTA